MSLANHTQMSIFGRCFEDIWALQLVPGRMEGQVGAGQEMVYGG